MLVPCAVDGSDGSFGSTSWPGINRTNMQVFPIVGDGGKPAYVEMLDVTDPVDKDRRGRMPGCVRIVNRFPPR